MEKYRLGIYAILRSWGRHVKEWLTFHHMIGVDRFYIMIDDTDNSTIDEIRKLPFSDQIIIHRCEGYKYHTRQLDAYRFFFERYGHECQWITILDGDEFMYSPSGRDLNCVMDEFERMPCGGLYLSLAIFGHCNHVVPPKGLIIDEFPLCAQRSSTYSGFKTITRATDIIGMYHWHMWDVKRPYFTTDGEIPLLIGNSTIDKGCYDKLCINHYQALSMDDWVIRHRDYRNGGFHGYNTQNHFLTLGGREVNRDIMVYSKQMRQELGKPIHNATPHNTVFLSHCDYPNPEEISATMLKTADKFGINVEWASYGNKFNSFIETKNYKILRALRRFKRQGKKYAFIFDSRDVAFTDTAYEILSTFNLVYQQGVMFNADMPGCLFPFGNENMLWKVGAVHGHDGIVNAGVCCGLIDDIITLWEQIDRIKRQYVSGVYEDYATKNMSYNIGNCPPNKPYEYIDPLTQEDRKAVLFDDDQFLIQTAQTDKTFDLINVDRHKQLLAMFVGENDNMPLAERRLLPYDDERSAGTAKIIHASQLSRNQEMWNNWVESEILNAS